MTKHRDLAYGAALPESFVDALAEFISTHISPNAVVNVLNTTTVQVPASSDNGQVCIAINGRWRYNITNANATHPGGAAGIYNLWATAADNNFVAGTPETDSTVYAFGIQILASAGTPVTALSRKIGTVEWNGSAITRASLLFDDPATRGTLEPGDLIMSAAATRSGALLADGASYLRTDYPALFSALGGASSPWGLPDGTHFNVPDFRGRTLIGAGTGSGLTARAAGATGGAETVLLAANETGVPAHTHPSGGSGSVTGTTGTGTSGNDSPDHTHQVAGALTSGHGSALVGAGSTSVFVDAVGTGLASSGRNNTHTHSIPSLSVSGTVTLPATPASTAVGATNAHANMQPWAAGYVFVKV